MIKKMALALLALVLSAPVWAHGAGYQAEPDATTVVLRFVYSVGEPMADTDVVVRAPDGQIWQRGRSDGAGRFSFAPERDGIWQVVADDGLGHEVRAELAVDAGDVSGGDGPRAVRLPPLLIYGLLLASLAANVALLMRRREG